MSKWQVKRYCLFNLIKDFGVSVVQGDKGSLSKQPPYYTANKQAYSVDNIANTYEFNFDLK
jgi:hypothetical protein